MKVNIKRTLTVFVLQLAIYSGLVVAYLFLVLHFLSDWLLQFNHKDLRLYAVLCVLLIVVQGLILEAVTSALFRPSQFRAED